MFTDDIDDDVLWIIVRRERALCVLEKGRKESFFSLFVWSKRATCVPFLTASFAWRRPRGGEKTRILPYSSLSANETLHWGVFF